MYLLGNIYMKIKGNPPGVLSYCVVPRVPLRLAGTFAHWALTMTSYNLNFKVVLILFAFLSQDLPVYLH